MFPDCSSGYSVNPWDCVARPEYYGPGPHYRMMCAPGSYDETSGTNWEWGYYNAISNGGDEPGIWRTPIKGEMDFAIYDRQKTNFTIGTKTNVNAVAAVIESVPGLMVFPDDFLWPEGLENRFGEEDVFDESLDLDFYYTKSYNESEFELLEEKGVLFLPECEINYEAQIAGRVDQEQGYVTGGYWNCSGEVSPSTKGALYPISFCFYGRYGGDQYIYLLYWNQAKKFHRMSVRLVCDAPSE